VLDFFGQDNVGIGSRGEYQCSSLLNFALADQKREFLLLGAESYEFYSNSAPLSIVHQINAMSFRFAYSSCGCHKQACEYVANEYLMNFLTVLVQVGVTLRLLLPT
jgi:hypothetical protein